MWLHGREDGKREPEEGRDEGGINDQVTTKGDNEIWKAPANKSGRKIRVKRNVREAVNLTGDDLFDFGLDNR